MHAITNTVCRPAILIGLFVAFGGVLYGYDTGTISGILAMDYFKKEFATTNPPEITSSQESLIVSILSAGTFFGALTASPVADKLGRRYGLMFSSAVVFNLGVILQTAATAQPMFIAGRFFAGFGVGLISAMSMYTVAPPIVLFAYNPQFPCTSLRPRPSGFVVPLSVLTSSPLPSVSSWLPLSTTPPRTALTLALTVFRLLFSLPGLSFSSLGKILNMLVRRYNSPLTKSRLIFLPETPRFLVKQDRHEQATTSLAKLRRLPVDHPAVVEELAEIVANHSYEMSIGTASYAECFKGTVGKRLMTGCFLQALQQLTGVNFIVRIHLLLPNEHHH